MKPTEFRQVGVMMAEMVDISFKINRDIFSALRQDPEHFVPEMRLAAAVK
jgi:hypothetical protein